MQRAQTCKIYVGMALKENFAPTPRVCQRCFVALPKHVHVCPNCKFPQEVINVPAGFYNLIFALLALALLVGSGWVVWRLFDVV